MKLSYFKVAESNMGYNDNNNNSNISYPILKWSIESTGNRNYDSNSYSENNEDINNMNVPCYRRSHSCVLINEEELLLLFGFNSKYNVNCSDCFIYSIKEKEWKKLSIIGDIPPSRYDASVEKLYDNCIILYGGSNGSDIYSDLYILRLSLSYSLNKKILISERVHVDGDYLPRVANTSFNLIKKYNRIYMFGGFLMWNNTVDITNESYNNINSELDDNFINNHSNHSNYQSIYNSRISQYNIDYDNILLIGNLWCTNIMYELDITNLLNSNEKYSYTSSRNSNGINNKLIKLPKLKSSILSTGDGYHKLKSENNKVNNINANNNNTESNGNKDQYILSSNLIRKSILKNCSNNNNNNNNIIKQGFSNNMNNILYKKVNNYIDNQGNIPSNCDNDISLIHNLRNYPKEEVNNSFINNNKYNKVVKSRRIRVPLNITPRCGHSSIIMSDNENNEKIYYFGGCTTGGFTNKILIFNVTKLNDILTQSKKIDVLDVCTNCCKTSPFTVMNDTINNYSNENNYQCTCKSWEIIEIFSGSPPPGLSCSILMKWYDFIYVIDGLLEKENSIWDIYKGVYIFDTKTNIWYNINNMIIYDHKQDHKIDFYYEDCDKVDFITNNRNNHDLIIHNRPSLIFTGCVYMKDQLFLIGGIKDSYNNGDCMDIISLKLSTWTKELDYFYPQSFRKVTNILLYNQDYNNYYQIISNNNIYKFSQRIIPIDIINIIISFCGYHWFD
ncbi:kelch motif family protein [Cryptosporidium muris RN66]|uniref:Kelch motif family protein n=1 Tax=Cryptosporidium muris (strain RN66) TaxID=441375 RepID=B6AJ06_CRYMR|nr:kelch motif family protein [Cryptosporidium muris RN66]EEA08197.1 kelch motif family protein [Cryptosporidium muris RN66]|eukprot:XP_002142546.1 kelch motif family protein [Cryptosporidium muris RN66]